MKKDCVLVYDSGIGGISTLKEILNKESMINYVYFADDKNCPYGNKKEEDVFKLVVENITVILKQYNVRLIVLACNTVTACCIDKLRACFNIPFVGVEPAIRLAMNNSKTKNILTICTNLTKVQERYQKLVESIEGNVYTKSLKKLAEDIEKRLVCGVPFDFLSYTNFLNAIIKEKRIDCLVLGCTHYSFIKTDLEKELKIKVFDGNEGVAKQVGRVVKALNIKNDNSLRVVALSSKDKKKEKCYETLLNS